MMTADFRTSCIVCGVSFSIRPRANGKQKWCSDICRFVGKVDFNGPDGCWEWQAAKNQSGYGLFYKGSCTDRKLQVAHRVSYQLAVGSIPEGLQLDHLCRNRACVNPDHLEPVTPRENFLRGLAPTAVTHKTGVCQRGHSMDDAVQKRNGERTCRTCADQNQRDRYAKKREGAR